MNADNSRDKGALTRTRIALWALGILCAAAAFVALYTTISPFTTFIPEFIPYLGRRLLDFLSLPLILLALAAFIALSVVAVTGARRLASLPLHRLELYYTSIVLIMLVTLDGFVLIVARNLPIAHVLFMGLALGVLLYLWTTLLVRISAGTLQATFYWCQVFEVIPLRSPTGAAVLIALLATSLFFLYNTLLFLVSIRDQDYSVHLFPFGWIYTTLPGFLLPIAVAVLIGLLSRDIIRITRSRAAALEDALAAERFRSELIANVTHDFRTPLTSLINYVDLIERLDIDNEQLADYTTVLAHKSQRLKQLLDDLLEASKAGSGSLEVTLEPVNLTDLLGQFVGDIDEELQAASLTYQGPVDKDGPLVIADAALLWRVFENLFSNIRKYAPPHTVVAACLAVQSGRATGRAEGWSVGRTDGSALGQATGHATLSLSNALAAPLASDPQALMAQFVRDDPSRSTEGHGLGLYISQQLMAAMGARLVLDASDASFTVRLVFPLAR